jgi:hypothetical protein
MKALKIQPNKGKSARVRKIKKAADVKRVFKQIYANYPDEPGRPKSTLDLTDRRAVAKAIRARLNRSKQA